MLCLVRPRLEHARMHAKHKGHEAMHAEMVLILIVTLVIAQLVLVQWKQRHPKSYNVSQYLDHFFHVNVMQKIFFSPSALLLPLCTHLPHLKPSKAITCLILISIAAKLF